MKLRIVSGSLKGRYITIPDKDAVFRPTQQRIRESVLEIIKTRLPGAYAADLCAGSGAVGFEMISRGAEQVDFIENNYARAGVLRRSAEALRITGQCRIQILDVKTFTSKSVDRYDIIYYDPPYDNPELGELTGELTRLLTDSGILICERRLDRKKSLHNDHTQMKPDDSREYGDTVVDFYYKK